MPDARPFQKRSFGNLLATNNEISLLVRKCLPYDNISHPHLAIANLGVIARACFAVLMLGSAKGGKTLQGANLGYIFRV